MNKTNRLRIRSGLPIGVLAERTGLAVSAIRYYESQGLLQPWRNDGGQRRFEASDIRRLSFIMIAQKFGFTIAEIRSLLEGLPQKRTPTKADWTRISAQIRVDLEERIAQMQAMRDKLDGCIGCGCLSLKVCKLYNQDDVAAQKGTGPRYLLGDEPETASETP